MKIAILDDYQGVALQMGDWSVLSGRADVTVFRDHLSEPAAVVERLKPFDVVCAMRERTPLSRSIMEQLPNLRLIVSTGPRNASIDTGAAKERGIVVCGTRSAPNGAAELAWALILAIVRNLPAESASLREGGWQLSVGGDLEGKTIGVLGLGRLGGRVAKVARAFGMNVIAWSQNLSRERAEEQGAKLVSKEELFREADIVTIHLVLSSRTRGIVGAPELKLMKPTAFLVNTSRGPLVDEMALIDVLRSRAIAGAALDVYDTEPLPQSHPFRSLDNVVATPHVGFVTRNAYELFYRDTIDDIVAWLSGSPVRVMEG
ncbi:MAG: D-2-hydroxyacid dehydrogenase family protein [Chloroflexi bacterium]|nr:D-2-hydroxyacid dehydrogenase family protein [Chloroflexota bacterium]